MATEKRLIDANVLSEELATLTMVVTGLRAGKGVLNEFMKEYRKSVLRIVDEQPTVDAVVVVHGHWLYYSTTMQECSNCQRHTARHKFKYCPHCGAVMEDHYNDV